MTDSRGVEVSALALADHLNDLVAVVDGDGVLRYLNRSGRRLLRLEGTPRIPARELVAAEDQDRFDDLARRVTNGETWSGALAMRSTVTGPFPTRTTLCPLEIDGAAHLGWVARDTSADRDIIRSLRERVFYDRQTGLPHRSLFLDRLDLLLRSPGATGNLAVLVVSPDRFDQKIDRFAPAVADHALRQIGARIATHVDGRASVHRWADENFVVLIEAIDDDDGARSVATDILDGFGDPLLLDDREVFFTVSIGVALGRAGVTTSDELLRQVDAANQLARQGDGGEIALFDDELRDRTARRADLETALRGATARGELALHYQPEIDLRTNALVACEALLRWEHPQWGRVSPAEFIPIAEESDLIIEVGDWVVSAALGQAARWAEQFPDRSPCTVAVNLSAKQFAAPGFIDRVRHHLGETGADPSTICFELTESVLLDDADETIAKLSALRDLGAGLAIDDFGTGYSSLSYLRRFPVDILKVDQAFVNGLGHDPDDSAIVQAVVHMGRALGMTTVAEGVETAHHVIELRELDCDVAQGYHFSPPVPAAEFESFLAAGETWRSI